MSNWKFTLPVIFENSFKLHSPKARTILREFSNITRSGISRIYNEILDRDWFSARLFAT